MPGQSLVVMGYYEFDYDSFVYDEDEGTDDRLEPKIISDDSEVRHFTGMYDTDIMLLEEAG